MKCQCGNSTFEAVEVRRARVQVTTDGEQPIETVLGSEDTLTVEYDGVYTCTICKTCYSSLLDPDDDCSYQGPRCSCGNNRFSAHQQCYHDIIVDGNNFFEQNVGCDEAETPYGPYQCTRCDKEYEDLDDLPN